MGIKVHILSGRDVSSRAKIELALRENQKDVPMLETLIKDMESRPEDADWWLSINEETQLPNGFISVMYEGTNSYLTRLWTKANSTTELDFTSQALISEWKKYALEEVEMLVADLFPRSPLIPSFEKAGFVFDKHLLSVYQVPTEFRAQPDQTIVFEKVDRNDAEFIYDFLVFPDLDIDSPIYIDKDNFLNLIDQASEMSDTIIVAKDIHGQIVGFGGSFIQGGMQNKRYPVLYGPHAFEEDVQLMLIDEFISFWKLKGYDTMRIIRSKPFHPKVVSKYNMRIIPRYSQSRFVYYKNN